MIRPILKTDLEKLLHWFNNPVALFLSAPKSSFPYTMETIEIALFKENETFALHFEDELIGCISVNAENELSHLFIKSKFRGKKHSKDLVKYIITLKNDVSVLVHKNQREQIKLFERMNFIDSSEAFEFSFESNREEFKKYSVK